MLSMSVTEKLEIEERDVINSFGFQREISHRVIKYTQFCYFPFNTRLSGRIINRNQILLLIFPLHTNTTPKSHQPRPLLTTNESKYKPTYKMNRNREWYNRDWYCCNVSLPPLRCPCIQVAQLIYLVPRILLRLGGVLS